MLRWPQDVPQAARETVGPASCFKIGRTHTAAAERLALTPVQLSGNALFLVTCGSVVLERTGQRLTVESGGGCLLLPGDVRISEIPDRVGRFIYHVIFFDNRVIKEAVKGAPNVPALAAIMRPGFLEMYPIMSVASIRWLCSLVTAGRQIPEGVVGILRLFLCEMIVPAYLFLHHGYFAHRQGLCLWLEEHVVSPDNIREIAAKYPGGARRFFTKFKIYQDVSPARWLRRRRMELASVWLKHGIHPFGDVRGALGYSDDKMFRHDYRLEHGVGIDDGGSLRNGPGMDGRVFKEIIRPFWLVDETTWQRRQQAAETAAEAVKTVANSARDELSEPALDPMTSSMGSEDRRIEQNEPLDVRLQNASKQFWNLQTSAVMALFDSRQEDYVNSGSCCPALAPTDLLQPFSW